MALTEFFHPWRGRILWGQTGFFPICRNRRWRRNRPCVARGSPVICRMFTTNASISTAEKLIPWRPNRQIHFQVQMVTKSGNSRNQAGEWTGAEVFQVGGFPSSRLSSDPVVQGLLFLCLPGNRGNRRWRPETCGAVGAIDLGGQGLGAHDRGLSQRFSAPWMCFHRRSDLNPPRRPIVEWNVQGARCNNPIVGATHCVARVCKGPPG